MNRNWQLTLCAVLAALAFLGSGFALLVLAHHVKTCAAARAALEGGSR